MGADPKQTTNSTQNTSQNSTSQTSPWGPTSDVLRGLVKQGGGIAPTDLSGAVPGIMESFTNLSSGKLPTDLWNSIYDNAYNAVGSRFAQAGRSGPSGAYANAITKQLTNSAAPYAYQGMQLAPSYLNAAAEAPFAGFHAKENFLLPIASQFGKTQSSGSGTSTGTQTTTTPTDWAKVGVGAGLGTLGLLSGNPMMAMGGFGQMGGGLLGGGGNGGSLSSTNPYGLPWLA